MNDRVQIWMDREHFSKLLALFWAKPDGQRITALAEFENEEGVFMELLAALEEANGNTANHEPPDWACPTQQHRHPDDCFCPSAPGEG